MRLAAGTAMFEADQGDSPRIAVAGGLEQVLCPRFEVIPALPLESLVTTAKLLKQLI